MGNTIVFLSIVILIQSVALIGVSIRLGMCSRKKSEYKDEWEHERTRREDIEVLYDQTIDAIARTVRAERMESTIDNVDVDGKL